MATDYSEKEREFLSELKADTGRDLPEWMAMIRAKGFQDKNEVIDWLRTQGFMFWKASWLERVHHNGGRPIYADPASARANAEIARHLLEAAEPLPGTAVPAPDARPGSSPPPVPAAARPPTRPAIGPDAQREVAALLEKAKGYRPLAEFLLRGIRSALPTARVEARGQLIVITEAADFAVLAPTPRELRLGLALGDRPGVAPIVRGRIAGAPDAITHVVALADARQVTPELYALIREARDLQHG